MHREKDKDDSCTGVVPTNEETGVNYDKLTGTGVMMHNVCFKVITSKKLLQALPGHCHL